MTPSPNTIHAALKDRTKDFHAALEIRLRVLLSDTLSLGEYVEIEKKLYGFYKPIESQLLSIVGWDHGTLDLQARLKIPYLVKDLLSLNVGSDEIAAISSCENLPNLQTVPQVLGCLYVLEGSTLGGTIITKHLKNSLDLDERRGCSFFSSYGKEVGPMWRGFLSALTKHSELHGDDEVIVASACQTFKAMDQWLALQVPQLEYANV